MREIMNKIKMKKYFLFSLISSLVLGALIASYLFLFGDFGDVETRVLLTVLSVGLFSMTGLSSSLLFEKNYFAFAFWGTMLSVVGFLSSVSLIWGIFNDTARNWETFSVLSVMSVSVAHASLMLMVKSESRIVKTCIWFTLLFILLVGGMLIYRLLKEDFYFESEYFYRLLGVFVVFDVLGSILTPILGKIYKVFK